MLKPVAEVVTFVSNGFCFQVKPSRNSNTQALFKVKPESTRSKYKIDLIDMSITEDKRIGLNKFC